jgi:hypothetical protein
MAGFSPSRQDRRLAHAHSGSRHRFESRRGAPASRPGTDPANELYVQASELVDAAARLAEAAGDPAAAPAVASTLACLEATLDSLTAATQHIRATTLPRLGDTASPLPAPLGTEQRAQLARSFDAVTERLTAARHACADTRASCGPALAEATAL